MLLICPNGLVVDTVAAMPDGSETTIESSQIRFTRGNTITLIDGTQVHNLWKEGKEG